MPVLQPWQWVLAALSGVLIGIAKTGMPGFGILVIPLMVLVVGDARASAGWLLPMLCTADCLAIAYYRRHADVGRLFGLLPWVVLGMLGGWFALTLPDRALRPLVGGIIVVMIAVNVVRRFREFTHSADTRLGSASYGVSAGFATTVANAAGPVMNLYLLGRRLPKDSFVATGAWFFLVVNLLKVPLYVARGMITAPSLTFDGAMVPAIVVGGVSGRVLLQRVPQRVFEAVVLVLTLVATVLLFLPAH